MDQRVIVEIVQQAILIILQLSGPVMMIGLGVGVAVALLQALTQIQEMTLAFVPKIFAIFFAIFLFFPMFLVTLVEFTNFLGDLIVSGDMPQDSLGG